MLLHIAVIWSSKLRNWLVISAYSSGGPYRRCSAIILSMPGLLLYFSFFSAFSVTSSVVN